MPSRNYAKRIRLSVFVSPVFNFKILRLEKTVGIDKRILIGAQGGIISGLSAQTLGKLNLEEGLHTGHGAIRAPGCAQVDPWKNYESVGQASRKCLIRLVIGI